MAGMIPAVEHPRARGITTAWLHSMCLWREMKEDRVAAESNMIALRMSDYIRKVRVSMAREALCCSLLYGVAAAYVRLAAVLTLPLSDPFDRTKYPGGHG